MQKTLIKLAGMALLGLSFATLAQSDCSFKGIPLYGKVQFVDVFPDIKIQMVDTLGDIKVKFVDAFADSCGEWQIVDVFPDFKVQWWSTVLILRWRRSATFRACGKGTEIKLRSGSQREKEGGINPPFFYISSLIITY